MKPLVLKVKKEHPDAIIPQRATKGSSGFDLYALNEITIPGYEQRIIHTGVSFEIPDGYEGQIRPRSGLAVKNSISVINSPGTIDADYRGEILIALVNHGPNYFVVQPGMRIAQIIFMQVPDIILEEASDLSKTKRHTGGFGSTGV
jgi:dUTP pyrophosphatase